MGAWNGNANIGTIGNENGLKVYLALEESFDLEKAVCNHGFFMMAPNRWIPSSKTFQRPLRLADNTQSVNVSISQEPPSSLLVHVHADGISSADQRAIEEQVRRMLRLSEREERQVMEYQRVHPQAKERGFGRIFRSPTLFEDLVKCLLLCNCKWSNTLKMARALCELQFDLSNNDSSSRSGKKRKRGKPKADESDEDSCSGNFPTSKELASFDQETFSSKLKVLGYRASRVLKLAKNVERNNIRLDEFEQAISLQVDDDKSSSTQDQVLKKLKEIKGFGSFTSASALMCIGYYHIVPLDTETIRHLQEVHGRKDCKKTTANKDVEEIYDKYSPFQSLAYWLELLVSYEHKFGKLSELPRSSYDKVSGSSFCIKEGTGPKPLQQKYNKPIVETKICKRQDKRSYRSKCKKMKWQLELVSGRSKSKDQKRERGQGRRVDGQSVAA